MAKNGWFLETCEPLHEGSDVIVEVVELRVVRIPAEAEVLPNTIRLSDLYDD